MPEADKAVCHQQEKKYGAAQLNNAYKSSGFNHKVAHYCQHLFLVLSWGIGFNFGKAQDQVELTEFLFPQGNFFKTDVSD